MLPTPADGDNALPKLIEDEIDPVLDFPPMRMWAARILRSMMMEAVLAVLVLISFVLVIVETDSGDNAPQWAVTANTVLLALYTIEVCARLFVYRLEFFCSFFNILDLAVVLLDLVSTIVEGVASNGEGLPSLSVLRIFRIARLARSYKVIVKFPQLALMVKGLVNAASAVMYGVVLVFVVISVWSICAVQLIHPVNQRVLQSGGYSGCSRCGEAFASVAQSMLTFTQQIICGDSWGQVTIPIIEEEPLTVWFFAAVFISVQLTIVNVMLAVIVDTALKTSQDDVNQIVQHKANEFNAAARALTDLCARLDQDGSGDLTQKELENGIDEHKEFRDHLLAMDIRKEDISLVFGILDADGSGSVNYKEFVTELFKMKTHDSHTLLVFIKHYVTEIRKGLDDEMKELRTLLVDRMQIRNPGVVDKMAQEEDRPSDSPTILPLEEKKASLAAGRSEIEDDLGEELRKLRHVISEDLARSIKYMAEKSEDHTRLLSSLTRERSPFLDGKDLNKPMADLAGPDAHKGDPLRTHLWDEHSRNPRPGGAAGTLMPPSPSLQPAPPSAWGMRACCGVQRDRQNALVLNNMKHHE